MPLSVCVKNIAWNLFPYYAYIVSSFSLTVNRFLSFSANLFLWHFSHNLELSFYIKLHQTPLDHSNQIAVVFWDYESNWT